VKENSRSADFVELHADRLFGFAMIVTLGDAVRAGKLAAEALAQGVDRIEQLHHPVRAAAWLRAAVTKAAGHPAWGHRRPSDTERRDALQALGVDAATYDALASLDVRGRAAMAVTAVEGFSPADVFEIVGSDEAVRHARRDFLTAYLASSETRDTAPPAGDLASRVKSVAAPVFSGPHK
jgi:DNA-directed RNA polymerase specialized sigma24 family protein